MISRLSAFMNKPKIAEHLIYKEERIINILKQFGYDFTKKELYRFQKDNNLPVENYIGNDVVIKLEELEFNRTNNWNKKENYSKSFPTIKARRGKLSDIANIELNLLDIGDVVIVENKVFCVSQRPSGQKFLLQIASEEDIKNASGE